MFLSNGTVVAPNVDTLGDRTPLFADANYYSTSALQLLTQWAAYSAIYKTQMWVQTVVRKLATSAARMPFEVRVKLNAVDSDLEAGPLQDLMARPNPRMSGFQLWEWTSSTRDVYGEAYWLKLRDKNGQVRELHPLHPTNVIVRRDNLGGLVYIYSSGTQGASTLPPIPEADIVAFTSYNPDNLTRGLSVLEGLRMSLLNEDAARRATAAMWANGARPSVVLATDMSLSQGAQDRLKVNFDNSHGGADNFGKTMVLEEGIKPTIVQFNADEMQYIETRKLNREEVCAAYDVSPLVVHILDHATFSNVTEQLRSQYRDTMAPKFVGFESVVNHQLVPDFYSDGSVYTRFNMDEVLRGDFETRAKAAVQLRNAGMLTGNQGLAMFNLPASDNPLMDEYFANAALVQLGAPKAAIAIAEAAPVPPAAASDATTAEDDAATVEEQSGKTVTVRSIMGSLARVKSTKDAIRTKLVDVHQNALDDFFAKQKKSALNASKFTGSYWDGELADLLHTLSSATAKAIGAKVAKDLGGSYNGGDIADYLETNSEATAKKINATTEAEIIAALEAKADDENDDDAIGDVFDGEVAARSSQISWSRVAVIAGLASLVAARQSGVKTKTWITGPNPRPDHASMDGETVKLGELFSNGMDGPGDYAGGADEVAGCNCDLSFS